MQTPPRSPDIGAAVSESRSCLGQRGELAGVPATNKSVKVPVTFIVDYENGKAKRWSSYLDTATLLRQIGAMK